MKNTRGKERATPTQLIKIAKARYLAGVTIFRLTCNDTMNYFVFFAYRNIENAWLIHR